MAEEPLLHQVDIKTEPFILNDKCAEVYRNNNLGTYSFLCFACGVSLDSSAADSIFRHLDTHYCFEGHDNFQGKQETVTLEDLINPIQTVFLDVNKPILENTTSTTIIADSFDCNICKNTYTTKTDLIAHGQVHTTTNTANIVGQTNINSDIKNEGDISTTTIEENIVDECNETTKEISKFQCKICFKVTKSARSLTTHSVVHLADRYKCKECNKVLKNANCLRNHYRVVHYKSRLKCEECGTVFKNGTLLKDHNCVGLKEMHESLKRIQEEALLEKLIVVDVNQPIIENTTSTSIEIIDSFKCDICENTFTTKSELIVHLQEHTTRLSENIVGQTNISSDNENEGDPGDTTDMYICDKCDMEYSSIPSLRLHYQTTHPELCSQKLFDCDQCDKKYTFKEELSFHRKEKHPETIKPDQYKCDKCFRVLKNSTALKAHYIVHLENRYKCKECDKVLDNSRSLRDHYRVHLNSRLKCEECSTVFKNETLLKDHNCVALKERKMHECGQCDRKYFSKYALTLHGQKKHKFPLPSYECDICHETLHNIRNFAEHVRSHSSTFRFKCNVCDKAFKSRSNYVSHKNVHNPDGAKKHVCNICNMKFVQISNYKTHLLRHKGETPFECTICKKGFYTSTELADHVRRTHTGERKFQCDQCGKHYFSASDLTQHKKYHTNERSHKCQFCDEKFYTTGTRKEHERKHTGEKPYKCKVCDFAFRTSRGLRQHSILHTGVKPYSCRFCDMKFAQNAGKRGHERNKHGF